MIYIEFDKRGKRYLPRSMKDVAVIEAVLKKSPSYNKSSFFKLMDLL